MKDVKDRRLRVLTLVDGIGTFGGGEAIARGIATHLDPDRFEVVFCVSRWDHRPEHEPALAELREAGVRFIGLGRHSRLNLSPWKRLLDEMRESPADILHSHKIGSNLWGALLAPRLGNPVFVAHEHTWSFEGQLPRRLADRHLIARRADAFIAVSSEDRRKMIEIEHIPPAKVLFIPNGIPTPPAADGEAAIRKELGLGPETPLIGAVAILRPQKALDVLIRAAAILRERIPDARVIIVGGDPESGEPESTRLQALISELGLTEHVSLLGLRTDVPQILSELDVAVLSSDYEGSPLSVMEYMEAGKPVVATRVGGVPDLVVHGETGLITEAQDPAGMAEAIGRLLGDPERARAMGAAGQERRRRDFTIEATAGRIGDLYLDLHRRRQPAGTAGS